MCLSRQSSIFFNEIKKQKQNEMYRKFGIYQMRKEGEEFAQGSRNG